MKKEDSFFKEQQHCLKKLPKIVISITEKYKCCGCSACVQACPKQCITMREDEEGFLYPNIDHSLCVDCGACEKVCPVEHHNNIRTPLKCFAAINPEKEIRMKSSSGGIFTMLAESIIDESGVVFGAAWDERWRVIHTYTETKEGLASFRGSKYLQSIIGESYKQAEQFLKKGRKVLFSGTPCQIAGLRLFLRQEYDNLLTVDFICHGVPSPGVFRWYLQEEVNKLGERDKHDHSPKTTSIPKTDVILPTGLSIQEISFRDKQTGWKNFSYSISIREQLENGGREQVTSLSCSLHDHPFLKGFLNDYFLRPSCYKCPAKKFKSGSDLTLADYWGYQGQIIKDDDKGISAILVTTDKGLQAFQKIECVCSDASYQDILRINGAAEHSAIDSYRALFYQQKGKSFEQVVKELTSTKILAKIRRKVWLMIHRQKVGSTLRGGKASKVLCIKENTP